MPDSASWKFYWYQWSTDLKGETSTSFGGVLEKERRIDITKYVLECQQISFSGQDILTNNNLHSSVELRLLKYLNKNKQKEESFDEYLGIEFDILDFLFELSDEDLFNIPEDEDQEILTENDSAEIDLNTIQALYLPLHPEHLAYIGTQFPMYHFNTQVIGNESWQDLDVLNRRNIGPHMNGLAIITGSYSVNIKDEIFQQAFECTKLLHFIFNNQDNGRVSISQRLSNLDEFHGNTKIVSFSNANPNLNTALQVLHYRDDQITKTGFFKGNSFLSLQGIAP